MTKGNTMRERAAICILGVMLAAAALGLLVSCSPDESSPTGVSSTKEITAFSFLKINNPMLAFDAIGVIYQDTGIITVDVYHALPCHEYKLVATFSTSGKSVVCRGETVTSGTTAIYYVPWRVLIVQAENQSTKDYTIHVRQKLDAFVANSGVEEPNDVRFNAGSGIFNDSSQRLSDQASYEAALGDLDGDWDLDAFVINYREYSKIWLNTCCGEFLDSGQNLDQMFCYGVALGDLDDDGDLDAYVANEFLTGDRVWLNAGDGTFTDSGQSLGMGNSRCAALGNLRGPPEVIMQ